MKKNDWIFILSLAAYSYLFWKEMAGYNVLAMNLILLGGIILKNRNVLRNRFWILSATGAMLSAISVALYGDVVSVFANLLSLLMASGFVLNRNNSMIVVLLQSGLNLGATIAYMITDPLERRRKRLEAEGELKTKSRYRKILPVILALLVTLIFFFIYRGSSVLFAKLTDNLNLDFISFGWILFTCFGAILVYGYYHQHRIPGLSEWDEKLPNAVRPDGKPAWLEPLVNAENEKFTGIVLLVLLNALLLVVNVLDCNFLFVSKDLPFGVSYSEYVHQGVGMLIFSIVCAMAVILYFFRGRLNFITGNKFLRALAIAWILQNCFMLYATLVRNEAYIAAFGLTYKRIGVYIYLLLAFLGLATTGWKVIRVYSTVFLIRINSWLFYGVLIASCLVNWDGLIMNYNLSQPHQPDCEYLSELSFRAWPGLVSYLNQKDGYVAPEFRGRVFRFLSQQERIQEEGMWQSKNRAANSVAFRIMNEPRIGMGTELTITNAELRTIRFFKPFANIQRANFAGNELTGLGEIPKYKNLVELNLNGNPDLDSLDGIQNLQQLEVLHLSNTGVTDFTPVTQLPNLKILYVNTLPAKWSSILTARYPQIQINYYTE